MVSTEINLEIKGNLVITLMALLVKMADFSGFKLYTCQQNI